MSNGFRMSMDDVYRDGSKIVNSASEFRSDIEKIEQITNQIITSEYTSNDAVAIAEYIRSNAPKLREMAGIVEEYGQFAMKASNRTAAVQENIISDIRRNVSINTDKERF